MVPILTEISPVFDAENFWTEKPPGATVPENDSFWFSISCGGITDPSQNQNESSSGTRAENFWTEKPAGATVPENDSFWFCEGSVMPPQLMLIAPARARRSAAGTRKRMASILHGTRPRPSLRRSYGRRR